MMHAIENFVRMFEVLLIERGGQAEPRRDADNDNDEMREDDRRWSAYR